MNKLDLDYQNLLKDILENGVKKETRNGGTISVFGRQIRHKMSEGFPLLTTKKMPFKTILTELLWFLRGDTNIKFLVDNNCHIWDGDAYKNYKLKAESSSTYSKMSEEEFIQWIKMDKAFAEEWGELGPIYGKQWRSWNTSIPVDQVVEVSGNGEYELEYNSIDQIQNLINDLKTNPDSRRLMVNAWNVGELDQMVLPPCHYGFQVYTRELNGNERWNLLEKKVGKELFDSWVSEIVPFGGGLSEYLQSYNIPTRAISLMWNQRSVDTFLGLPFNIASYGLLLEIIAKEVNMVPEELIGNLGDVHLYSNHIEQAKEQIGRELTYEERLDLIKDNKDFLVKLSPYLSNEHVMRLCDEFFVPTRTREPYELPTLKINPNNEMRIGGGIFTYDRIDFELLEYQSHPTIKAPLSN